MNEWRGVSVTAYGNTADELELDALDKAREIFGADTPLVISRNYQIGIFPPGYDGPLKEDAAGRRCHAHADSRRHDDALRVEADAGNLGHQQGRRVLRSLRHRPREQARGIFPCMALRHSRKKVP